MPDELRAVLAAVERATGAAPTRAGEGWSARCPAHDDDTPSLSISAGRGGKTLLHCHAGCAYADVIAALDMPRGPAAQGPAPTPPKPGPLPAGERTAYRSVGGAELAVVVRRDTAAGKHIRPYRPTGDGLYLPGLPDFPGGRPLLDLPGLAAAPGAAVIVVEGEKCAAAVKRAWPGALVTTWLGGAKAWRKTDWTPLAGRQVKLLADADDPGRAAMRELGRRLLELRCEVLAAFPAGDDGADIADWLAAGGPGAAADKVKSMLAPYAPPPRRDPAPGGNGAAPPASATAAAESGKDIDMDELLDNAHFRILGAAAQARAVVRLKNGDINTWPRKAFFQLHDLLVMAPAHWWQRLTGEDAFGPHAARRVGDNLSRAVEAMRIVDVNDICGRGAARDKDGAVAWNAGDRIIRGERETPIDDDAGTWAAGAPIPLTADASDAERRAVVDAVMAYRWETPGDGQRFVGWLAAASAAGAMEWRPHLMLIAPAATGKSWLLENVVSRLYGAAVMRIADATPAALARMTAGNSLPVIIDEAEPTHAWVQDMLALLRVSAGASGARVRSDTSAGPAAVVAHTPRFAAMLTATAAPLMSAADASRIVIVNLGRRPVDDWPAVSGAIAAAMAAGPRLLSSMIREAGHIADEAQRLGDEIIADTRRNQMIAAAINAGWRWWGGEGMVEFAASERDGAEAGDAVAALHDILALTLRVGGEERSVGMLARSGDYETTLADRVGVRIDAGALLIAPLHAGLRRALRRGRLEHVNLRHLIEQIPGAEWTEHPLRFGSSRHRAWRLAPEVLAAAGVDLSYFDDEYAGAAESGEF